MKILITGGAGFVGANLATHFSKKGHKVISMDNLVRRGSDFSLDRLKKHGVKFIHGDIRNPEDFDALPHNLDFILNTAAEPSATEGYKNPRFDLQNNTFGMLNVLEFARKNGASVIQWSTNKVYCGDKINAIKRVEKPTRYEISDKSFKHGIPETFSIDGGDHSIYGLSKVMSDIMCQEYAQGLNTKTVVNRFSCLCGPYQWGKPIQGWYAWWAIAFKFKMPLHYIGWNGKQVRDVLHINDIAKLVELEMENIDKINGEVFNVGGGPKNTMSLIEASDYLENKFGYPVPLEILPNPRKADHCVYISDIRKVKNVLGWEPKIDPKMAFDDIVGWVNADKEMLRKDLYSEVPEYK